MRSAGQAVAPAVPFVWLGMVLAWLLLAVQVLLLRPPPDRRAAAIVAGRTPPRSRLQLAYIALEAAKIPLLVALGATQIAAAMS